MGRLQNNPSIGWVHPKSTHAHPLTWGNKYHSMSIMGKKRENIYAYVTYIPKGQVKADRQEPAR